MLFEFIFYSYKIIFLLIKTSQERVMKIAYFIYLQISVSQIFNIHKVSYHFQNIFTIIRFLLQNNFRFTYTLICFLYIYIKHVFYIAFNLSSLSINIIINILYYIFFTHTLTHTYNFLLSIYIYIYTKRLILCKNIYSFSDCVFSSFCCSHFKYSAITKV